MNLDLETGQRLGDGFALQWGVLYSALQKLGVDQAILDDACAALTKVGVAAGEKLGGNVTPLSGGGRK